MARMDARDELARELGGELAAARALSDAECAELLSLFRAARRRERADLDRSVDEAVGALPRLLRGPAKAIMFGRSGS